jgi:hypothetical protein
MLPVLQCKLLKKETKTKPRLTQHKRVQQLANLKNLSLSSKKTKLPREKRKMCQSQWLLPITLSKLKQHGIHGGRKKDFSTLMPRRSSKILMQRNSPW